MKTKKAIYLTGIIACCLFFLSGFHEAKGGGRKKITSKHALSESIIFTAWHRNNIINIAVCNISNNQHSLKIAIGTCDVGKHIYAGQSLKLLPNSIKFVYFPILKQQTPRGDLKTSDYVFVFSEDQAFPGLIYFTQIQNIYAGSFEASLNSFLVASGGTARFSYTMECDDSLRIILVAKSIIKTAENLFISSKSTKEILKPACTKDVKKLKLSAFYEKKIIKQIEKNYCYVIKPGQGGVIIIIYDVGEIKNSALIGVPVYCYTFKPDGGLQAGGGHGLTFMAYNPNVVQIKTLLRLSIESGKSMYRSK